MNFLVIGLGSAGQRHLRVLHKFWENKANIYAYRGSHTRGLISDGLDHENFSINPIEFYKAIEINTIAELSTNTWDLVIIATPPDSHYIYLQKIIKNSKRILVEKPLTVKVTEALNIINLAELNNIPVISFSDRRFFKGILYKTLGFKFEKHTSPSYIYWKNDKILNRMSCQKHKLNKLLEKFDNNKTEYENMVSNGWKRVWDSGNAKWIY